MMDSESRPPFSPFDLETALAKVQAAEDGWNSRDPEKVALAYTPDSVWRNRDVHLIGRPAIIEFLAGKWEREQDYALRKGLWGFRENRIAVGFQWVAVPHRQTCSCGTPPSTVATGRPSGSARCSTTRSTEHAAEPALGRARSRGVRQAISGTCRCA